jgi:hypothetical protein
MAKKDDLDLSRFFPEDPDPSGLDSMCATHHEVFLAYMKAGFHREEAIQLVCTFVTVTMMAPDGP